MNDEQKLDPVTNRDHARCENHAEDAVTSRRAVVTGMGVAVAGLAAAASAHAQLRAGRRSASGFRPERHALDAWLDEASDGHRIFIDSATTDGTANAMLYAHNLFRTHQSAYDAEESDLNIVVCFRHVSTPFGFSDRIWEKYGEKIRRWMQYPATETALETNPLNTVGDSGAPLAAMTIDAIAARGAQYAICENATRSIAEQLAAGSGSSASEIFEELTSNGVSKGRFVPAGVITATRAQEYGYSLLYAG